MEDKYAAPHLRMASVWTIMTAVTELNLEISFLVGKRRREGEEAGGKRGGRKQRDEKREKRKRKGNLT
jgi:hypothetical protein